MAVHAFAEGEAAGRALAEALGAPFGLVRTHVFPDGELLPTVPPPAKTTLVYRSLDRPNDKLVELALAGEAWRRMGAGRLVLVAPYLAYMRQDSAFAPGQAISQRAIAALLDRTFDRIVTVNAHLHRTASFPALFPTAAADNLSAAPAIASWLAGQNLDDALLLGPDVESTPLVEDVAKALGAPWAAFAKTRRGDRSVDLTLGASVNLAGRTAVLIDDICSTGATLAGAAIQIRARGAADIQVVVAHALFEAEALATLHAAGVSRIVSTDAVRHDTNAIPLAGLLAEALKQEIVP